jgi:polyisoprenoid-binding protein YceI
LRPARPLRLKLFLPALLGLLAVPSASRAEAPVFAIDQANSTVTFHVKASRPIQGRFKVWKASLTFTGQEVSTGVLDVTVDTGSVDSGSAAKNSVLKGDKGFDSKTYPNATFHSTKIAQTGPDSFAITGDFTLRGVTKPETLVLKVTRAGSGGEVNGTMGFDRRDFGMNVSVPFVTIGDRVEVAFDIRGARVSGPPLLPSP